MEELLEHLNPPDVSTYLWRTVIAFENYTFTTLVRGKDHTGATKFRYTVSRPTGTATRHYAVTSMLGYGNELLISTADGGQKQKSISRSTMELAFRNALEEPEKVGCVSGPRKLDVPGVRPNLYAMFLRFGVITTEWSCRLHISRR